MSYVYVDDLKKKKYGSRVVNKLTAFIGTVSYDEAVVIFRVN